MSAAPCFSRSFIQRSLCRAAFALPLAAMVLALVGCGSHGTGLSIRSAQSQEAMLQSFDNAYAGRQANGDIDIVLTRTTACPASTGKAAVQQLMHVRVLWESGYGMQSSLQQLTANAVFHWYVSADSTADLVEYEGTGLVELDRQGDAVGVKIVKANLTPKQVTGTMTDPLGNTSLTGSIVAERNNARVNALLSQAKEAIAAAKTASPLSDSARMSADASR